MVFPFSAIVMDSRGRKWVRFPAYFRLEACCTCNLATDALECRSRPTPNNLTLTQPYDRDLTATQTGTPASLGMAVGFVATGLANGFVELAAAAAVLGFGNGMSAGLIMTLGADLAPKENRGCAKCPH